MAARYAGENVAARIPSAQRPKAGKPAPSHFTNDEVARLVPEVPEGVYRVLVQTPLGTGARLGELLALEWGDLNPLGGRATVWRTYSEGRTDTPKSGSARTVYRLGDLVDVLGAGWGVLGEPGDEVLMFPGTARGGHLDPTTVTARVLYPAMTRAGVPRVGPCGERRTFHSLRHTFARRALEGGAPITWAKEQLGHSSITVTVDKYGRWETDARRKEAERLGEAFVA